MFLCVHTILSHYILTSLNFQVTQFLKLYSQFEQLGFKSQNVREALLRTSLDQDRTLDILTAA